MGSDSKGLRVSSGVGYTLCLLDVIVLPCRFSPLFSVEPPYPPWGKGVYNLGGNSLEGDLRRPPERSTLLVPR